MIDLKAFRKKNSITQVDLAAYLAVGQGFISQIEKGERPLPKDYISRLLANPYGWDTSVLSGVSKPQDTAEKQPEDRATIEKLFALLGDVQETNKTLLEILKEKDRKIEELHEELRSYREHKGDNVHPAEGSSCADAV